MTLVSERPAPTAPRQWRFPAFTRSTVAGGRVLACHLPGRPLAVVSLVSGAGAMTEPTGADGVSELLARLLSEGTQQHDSYRFAVAGERLGASWHASSGWDSMRTGFEVPVGELAAATDLLAQAVRDAAIDEASVERIRNERVDEIHVERSVPAARASQAFAATVFADASRYSRPDGGDVVSVEGLTREGVTGFAASRLAPDTSTLVVVGDLEVVDVDAVARSVFAGWTSTSAPAPEPVVTARAAGRRVLVVDRPGAVQSMLSVGHDGPSRQAADYVALTTMSLVLGGLFSSRLNTKLREEKGYAYGAFGGFEARADGGVFSCRAAVQTEVTMPALVDLVAEVEHIHADGVTDEERDAAVAYRAGVFPINFAGVSAVASGLADVATHDLADDHFDRLRADVMAIGTSALNDAAAQRLRPQDLVTVIVGDAASFVDELRSADLGPVEVVSDKD